MKKFLISLIFLFSFISKLSAVIIDKINVNGNKRVSNETIIMFSDINIGDDISSSQLNEILKNIYDSSFFEDVSVELDNSTFNIFVKENPIIDQIIINGIKAKKIEKVILDKMSLKQRSSFNVIDLENNINIIEDALRDLGFYFANIESQYEVSDKDLVTITFNIVLGNKAKIEKISFLGNKIFKDSRLKSIIVSEEFKPWKFLSGKKYLNEKITLLDENLLKNYYLNKGYYNVKITKSYAKLITEDTFELIYNIDAGVKTYFNDISLILPNDFDYEKFKTVKNYFNEIKDKPYSLTKIENILKQLENLSLYEQFESVDISLQEQVVSDKINLLFTIEDTKDFYINRINILGNNVTRENVIRNQFEIDEGDPFNEILLNKSVNNLKNLNFFKKVSSEVVDIKDSDLKEINIIVEEKATGEISAGIGAGTSGGTLGFAIRENNYLGKGIGLDANLTLTNETIKGLFSVTNPNYLNSNKSANFRFEAQEINRLNDFGYKTNKTGFEIGTTFEFFEDVRLGLGLDNFYEVISTDSTASARQKAQEGSYWDTFLNISFDTDKRNQKFETNEGFRSYYSIGVPILSDTNTLTNTYDYKFYTELYENNITTASILLKSANSISGNDIKLSERLFVPSRRLRGFENGKIGPKDGSDFVGGNFIGALNFTTSFPNILQNLQNVDFVFFIDAANIWGVDYDSAIDNNSKIRSSAGLGIDWLTAVGPLNFSLSQPLTKSKSDITETFRFNIGTTF